MSRRKKTTMMQQLRSRGVFAIVAAVIVAGFVASVVAFNDGADQDRADATPTPSTATPNPTPSPTAQAPVEAESTCGQADGGTTLVEVEGPQGWRAIDGTVKPASDAPEPPFGEAALLLDNGQTLEDGWVEYVFDGGLDLSEATGFVFAIRQNGNVFGSSLRETWRVRFRSEGLDYFERVFSPATVGEAVQWCADNSTKDDWVGTENADWTSVEALQVMVPAYGGSGAATLVWYDDVRVLGMRAGAIPRSSP